MGLSWLLRLLLQLLLCWGILAFPVTSLPGGLRLPLLSASPCPVLQICAFLLSLSRVLYAILVYK